MGGGGVKNMNENSIQVLSNQLQVKEWEGQRVITFQDIDTVHQRPRGTASRNFRENRDKFIEGTDFFKICADEIRRHNVMEISNMARDFVTVLTESGYLMIVKSLNDDLAWTVQRLLVNYYFRAKEEAAPVEETTLAVVNHETILRAASIMASCPNSTRYVLNCLRHIIPDIDQPETVTATIDAKPVEIPKLPAPETAVVTTTKRKRKRTFPYFNCEKLRRLMAEKCFTTYEVADRVGCAQGTVSDWRSGKYYPSRPYRKKLCAALGVAPEYFDK